VFVIDWGIAEWLFASSGGRMKTVAGTPRYMAPEQCDERVDGVDGRVDIFSLGAVLEDLVREEGSRSLLAIARKASAPDPANRYEQVQHLADDLKLYLDYLPVSAYDETFVERVKRFTARNRVLMLLLATYVLVRFALFLLSRA
jgi:hypothetical protein